jgi:putative two-component system response regulator
MTAVLIMQAALLMGATLVVDVWVRSHIQLTDSAADKLFVFLLSIDLSILALTGVVFYLISRRYKDQLEDTNERLTDEVRCRLAEALSRRNALIHGLARLADYRDTDTGDHLERIGRYVRLLAQEMRASHSVIDDEWTERLVLASSLHDIGKVGVPDSVLLKPGKLTDEERTIMERHTIMGADTLLSIRSRFGADPFLDMGINIALAHHERWDGSGYPFGLQGNQISLAARIVALADVYDALTSERVYKAAYSHEKARAIILDGRGSHFDPDVIDAFERCEHLFNEIRAQDHPAPDPHEDNPFNRAYEFIRSLPNAA